MRIIVTGGTGMIGSRLTPKLVEAGHEVIVLSRNPAKYSFPPGVEGVQWDGKTTAGWGHLVDGAGAVINLAGASIAGDGFPPPRRTEARKKLILQSRLDAGTAVSAAIAEAENKPAVLIQMSAIGIYGDRGDEVITESSTLGDGFVADVVKQWEQSVTAVEEMGVRVVYVRTGLVYVMDEHSVLHPLLLVSKMFVGGPLGDGRQYYSWIHIDDVLRAMLFLLENESTSGVYNLTAPHPLPQKAVMQEIGKVIGRPSFMPAPAFAIKAVLGEVSDLVLDGQRVLPTRLQEAGFSFKFEEVDNALMDLLNA